MMISRRFPHLRPVLKVLEGRFSSLADRIRPKSNPIRDWGCERTTEERVQAAYRCVLNRSADAQGLAHWIDFLDRGGRFDDLLGRFVKSAEFLNALEQMRREALRRCEHQPELCEVQIVYRCLLGREPDVDGQAHWTAFRRGGGSLQDMLTGFLRSSEFRRRLDAPPPTESPVTDLAMPEPAGAMSHIVAPRVPKLAVLGNRQAGSMARGIQALLDGPMPHEEYVTTQKLTDWELGRSSPESLFTTYDKIFVQPWIWNILAPRYARFEDKVVLYPSIAFMAYQPDLIDVRVGSSGTVLDEGPLGRCHSSVAFLGWKSGLGVAETVQLFRTDVLKRLGHFDCWPSAELSLLEEGRAAGLSLDVPLARWKAQGCFMHQPAHPKRFVLRDIARLLLERLDIPVLPAALADESDETGSDGVSWPVYPGIAEALGCRGSLEFKFASNVAGGSSSVKTLGIHDFVAQSLAVYSKYRVDELSCRRLSWPSHDALLEALKSPRRGLPIQQMPNSLEPGTASSRSTPRRKHPYAGLPAYQFWRSALEDVPPSEVDPVVGTKFRIGSETRVAAAGSCFALHISRHLRERGFNFLQTESDPMRHVAAVDEAHRGGGFSARFGYVYTARQLLQLLQRAYGRFSPVDRAWKLETGRFVDPFRPTVEHDGFESIDALETARAGHLAAVRQMFETLEVFVFTLGLTEAWRARCDGAVFPLAPGVAGGGMDPELYEFVNFTVAEVDGDLRMFIEQLQAVNPRARLILTVSPVPLVATYPNRHVMVSTSYSKSVLRVAAEQVAQGTVCCDYFPSYEIITGNFNRGRYFARDLRSVEPAGVDHVMRLFFSHYSRDGGTVTVRADTAASVEGDARPFTEARRNSPALCDEELLAAALR